jgi:hypothetical protein
MASCDLKTTNKEYMISKGAIVQGSLKIPNERLFDIHNAEIRDSANQRFSLSNEELPFTKTERRITRNDYLRRGSDFFIEWGFNEKFFEKLTPIVEMYNSFEEDIYDETPTTISTYSQMQISFEESIDDNNIVSENPIRSTFPYEAEDYMADVKAETKANLTRLQFKEESCNI